MSQRTKITIPPRYLVKLVIEMGLFAFALFLYSISEEWLERFGKLGPGLHILLRFAMFLFGLSLVVRLLAMIYRHRKHIPYNKKDNVTIGLSNISILVVTIYTVISFFELLGLSPKDIFTSLSIVAAAFAILSKDFITDIISGIAISFGKEISIDDFVKIGELRGKIIDINITKTALLNEDDDLIFLPNSTVFRGDIINYTKKQIKKTNIDFEVPTGSFHSVDDLEEQLIKSLAEYHHLIEPNSYLLRVVHIRKDFIAFKFQYNLIQFTREMERQIKRKCIRSVVKIIYQGKSR
ncbi:MAG TPA: mechanosensitive ion channel domain-containing protein [Saprospiraceae bacterium]|nr:mechanosensitive ion channel domain-containing protein [Saprospiraceae bacterium]